MFSQQNQPRYNFMLYELNQTNIQTKQFHMLTSPLTFDE